MSGQELGRGWFSWRDGGCTLREQKLGHIGSQQRFIPGGWENQRFGSRAGGSIYQPGASTVVAGEKCHTFRSRLNTGVPGWKVGVGIAFFVDVEVEKLPIDRAPTQIDVTVVVLPFCVVVV